MNKEKIEFHIGASRIKKILLNQTRQQRSEFLKLLFPMMSEGLRSMASNYPDEIQASGAYIKFPKSWEAFN